MGGVATSACNRACNAHDRARSVRDRAQCARQSTVCADCAHDRPVTVHCLGHCSWILYTNVATLSYSLDLNFVDQTS